MTRPRPWGRLRDVADKLGRVQMVVPPKRTGASPPVMTAPDRTIGTGYTDEQVVDVGERDGAKEFGTKTWGDNHEPQMPNVIARGGTTAQEVVLGKLHGDLIPIYETIAQADAKLPGLEDRAVQAISDEERANTHKQHLVDKMHAEDVAPPDSSKVFAIITWVVLLVILGLDLVVLAPLFAVFGLDDSKLFWFVTRLELGAASTVVAMAFAAHTFGEELAALRHDLVQRIRHRRTDDPEQQRENRSRAAMIASGVVLIAGVIGIITFVQLGLSDARKAQFELEGVSAHASSFIAVALAVVAAGVLWSMGRAHPYATRWRLAERACGIAARVRTAAEDAFTTLLARQHALCDKVPELIKQYTSNAHTFALDSDRQQPLYAWALQHGQPEPVTEKLVDALPTAVLRPWLEDMDGSSADGTIPARFRQPDKYDEQKYLDALAAVAERRTARDAAALGATGTDEPAPTQLRLAV